MAAYTDGCSQSGATHTVNPLLACSLISAEEDPNSLQNKQTNAQKKHANKPWLIIQIKELYFVIIPLVLTAERYCIHQMRCT
jgi:hypothetical protein